MTSGGVHVAGVLVSILEWSRVVRGGSALQDKINWVFPASAKKSKNDQLLISH